MIEIAFWGCLALLAFTYAGFPLLVIVRGRWRPAEVHGSYEPTPSVSLIIAAYNEADAIAAKLDNALSLDYPADRLEILVASDGSSDGTDEIVRAVEDPRVRLLSLPRRGKAAALNDAVREARGDVLVFSDANSMYAPDALRELLWPLADPAVGGAAGDQRYVKRAGGPVSGAGERGYWNVDRLLKRYESRGGNVISATGAIYAMRRELFQAVPEGVTDDFVTSTRVIAQGRRLVFAERAVACEPTAASGRVEFGRKVRVMTRGLRGVIVMRRLLNPLRYGFYAVQLACHKVLRRLMFAPLLILLVAAFLLREQSTIYHAAWVAQLALYGAAAAGLLLATVGVRTLKLLSIPAYFCLVNAAAAVAVGKLLCGRKVVTWETQRAERVAEAH